ncbi:MAG: hypothetical protein NTV06_07810 [candidate division Zixibacteria bacterium]|nr:hypothetical protein [candidate division Zixibacteria bacterium]
MLIWNMMKYAWISKTFLTALAVIFISPTITLSLDKYDLIVSDDNSGADQLTPRVAVGNSGKFIIAWADKRNGQSDIYCQYFDSSGMPLGTNWKINDDNSDIPQFEPSVSGNISNQFAMVWKDYRNGSYPFHSDIYFWPIDTLSPSNLNVTTELPDSSHESPDIAMLSDGSSVVVWSDYRNRNWDIYGQRLGVNNQLLGKNFRVNSNVGTYQHHSPRIAAFPSGGFVVVWYDNRSGNDDIFVQRFDLFNNPIGGNLKVNDDPGTSKQVFPVVAADGKKRFYVAWVDWRNGTYPQNPDIYFRRFDSLGVASGASQRVNLNDGGRPQKEVSICSDWIGNLCLVWADSSSSQWDCYAQIVDNTGKMVGNNFKIHQVTTGRQLQPDVETDGYKLFFVWADFRSGDFDIYASVKQYNSPTLIGEPNSLNFTMEVGGGLPEPKAVNIKNAGFGELHWSAISVANWISVNPFSGITPATLNVSITADTLPYGSYYGLIRLINQDSHDSAAIIPVRLSVTAPLLKIDPDTLYFKVFAALGNPAIRRFQVNNPGTGNLAWTAVENCSWFSIDCLI